MGEALGCHATPERQKLSYSEPQLPGRRGRLGETARAGHADGSAPIPQTTHYALASHGTCQDSISGLRDWPYGLFLNLRNSLWSCNRYHQSTWDRNGKTVATYELPVAVSNGYGDDTGPSNMTKDQVEKLMTFFKALGNRKLEFTWMEEPGTEKTHKGRPSHADWPGNPLPPKLWPRTTGPPGGAACRYRQFQNTGETRTPPRPSWLCMEVP